MAAPAVTVQTGVLIPESPISLPHNTPLVAQTPCIQWIALGAAVGAAPQVQLPHHLAVKAFLRRCSPGPAPADMIALNQSSPLTFLLTGAAWSRILGELTASGLFAVAHNTMGELRTALDNLTVQTPANLAIIAADLPLTIPNLMIPGGAGAAAVAARALLNNLKFLEATRLPLLMEADPAMPARFAAICELVGALGPVHTHASRQDPVALLHMVADEFRRAKPGASDAALARSLKSAVLSAQLAAELVSTSLSAATVEEDFVDAFAFRNPDSAEEVVRRRLLAAAQQSSSQNLLSVLSLEPEPSARLAVFNRLCTTFAPAHRAPAKIVAAIGEVERGLTRHQAGLVVALAVPLGT